jgi:hypothetical protein
MRTIKVKKENWHLKNYKKDIERIQETLMDKGFYATEEQCVELWELYSDNEFCAGWLVMDSYSKIEIYDAIRKYFEPGPEGSIDTRYM